MKKAPPSPNHCAYARILPALPVLFGFGLCPPLAAETIHYPDDATLAPAPQDGKANSLFPTAQTSNNSIMVDDPAKTLTLGHVIGGVSNEAGQTISGNHVAINAGAIGGDVWGGLDHHGGGVVSGNSVTVTGGTFALPPLAPSRIYGGAGKDDVIGNIVTINAPGVTVGGAAGGFTTNGRVNNNEVHLQQGIVGLITGGAVRSGGTGSANNNKIFISGGEVTEGVIVGLTEDSGNVTGNSITISGGTVNKTVIAGLSNLGDVTNNSVTLSGAPNLANAILQGGSSRGISSGNSLNVQNSGMKVLGVLGFQTYNFYLPSTIIAGQTMLTVTNGIGWGHLAIDLDGATVQVGVQGGGSPLKAGDSIILIDSATGIEGALANSSTSGQGMQGISLLYDFDLSITPTQLQALVTSGGATDNPQTKALSEGRAASLGFMTQGADMAASMGGIAAASSLQNGMVGFGAASGANLRYNTGSHVDVSGFSLVTGLGWRASNLLIGAFLEAGWGRYDSHNSFTNAASVKGDGDTDYYGGGLLGRYDFANGLYGEGSVRVGYASTDFSSNDFGPRGGTNASYDSGAIYYGAHAGLGYILPLAEQFNLDLSSKYLWTHQNSDDVTVAGDAVSFKASNSQRWRNGARLNGMFGADFAPYVGAAWEYEFDGDSKASINGRDIATPSLKGGTGIGELGVRFKPAASAFSADLGVQGYVGMREGVTGGLQLKYQL